MQLVIVESPAKAKTIENYLGKDFKVLASYGHVRDFPKKDDAVRPDDDFAMSWEIYQDKRNKDQVKAIVDAAKKSSRVVLATDPDREGEAISWHVLEVLKKRKALPDAVDRVTFNAITKSAVTEAMGKPRQIDMDLVDAYLGRRALDRLFGFTLSPVLWRKLPGAKSAGRVQSVALRIIVDREREIEAFRADEYWSIVAHMEQDGTPFDARLVKYDGRKLDKLSLGNESVAGDAKKKIENAPFTIEDIETRPLKRNPSPPFTTSTLQQEAARKLGFNASHTMRCAQKLYEAGLITYMRTDGVQMDGSAISACRKAISQRYDGHYLPEKPRHYSSKAKNAQEAHEAIRPTNFTQAKASSGDDAKLYDLIFKRAMASQMQAASLERTTVTLRDPAGLHELRATGQVIKFPGFLAVYQEGFDDRKDDGDDDEDGLLPVMRKGDTPAKKSVDANQHFTQPPPRFSEASLVKRLEELGIGRPSTYASTIQVLRDRDYVRMEKNRFFAEESGRLLTSFLERFFEQYVAYDFTAGLEDELDVVSDGREEYKKLLTKFWKDFKPKADEVMEKLPSEVTEVLDEYLSDYLFPERADGHESRWCPLCDKEGRAGGKLALRGGKFGAFIACANYPECKFHPTLRAARRGWRGCGRGCGDGQPSRNGSADRTQVGPVRSLRTDGRGERGETGIDPQGSRRFRSRMGDQADRPAADRRAASRNGRGYRGRDRPLRTLSPAFRQICEACDHARCLRNRHERGRFAAGRSGQPQGRRTAKGGAGQDFRQASDIRRRDEGVARSLWPLRHRRHDQCDDSQGHEAGGRDRRTGDTTDRRTGGEGTGEEETQESRAEKEGGDQKTSGQENSG